jgi:hypothetical protein
LAQLCCTCWALAALAELGVQGPESVPTDQLNFLLWHALTCSRRAEKGARKFMFWRSEPDLSRNVRISECSQFWGEKGFWLLLPMCILTGFSIVRESGNFQLVMRICYFFCVNIHVPEKPFAKAVIFPIDISVTKVSYF